MNPIQICVWTKGDSSRLRYVLDWLLKERLGLDYFITTDKTEASNAAYCIAYGFPDQSVNIHDCGLLWEDEIREITVNTRVWDGLFTLFFEQDSSCTVPFDLFSGIFYLLSRYEEYLEKTTDLHRRFPATHSILYQHEVLERPVVDEWVEAFRQILIKNWSIDIQPGTFSYRPSYDIDIAWSYKNKGWKRNTGGLLKDLLKGNRKPVAERVRVLSRLEKDPYDSYQWLKNLHAGNKLKPIWFFLLAHKASEFDKNISPKNSSLQSLIQELSSESETGIHPSYFSDTEPEKLLQEKSILEDILQRPVTKSRQHYIKFRFPETGHQLINSGISEDYSMGYATHFGFRSGTGASFFWYDLSEEKETRLRLHPFVFMDTTGRFDLGLSAEASFQRLRAMTEKLIQLNAPLITIMHNFSLGSDPGWNGWKEAYSAFVSDLHPYLHKA